MPKTKDAMSKRQCEIAAESYSTCLLAQSGYDVFVQYGAHQQHYDLVALKGERTIRISVKGSQDGGWMLAVGYKTKENTYHDAIKAWRAAQPDDAIFVFVGFLEVSIGGAPRAYIATLSEVFDHLNQQYLGRGHTALDEDNPTYYPRSKYKDKIPEEWCYSTERIDALSLATH